MACFPTSMFSPWLKSKVIPMPISAVYPTDIGGLVASFIARHKLNRDVANRLGMCPPFIQWLVIAPSPPRTVWKPNGFVMGRILRALRAHSDYLASIPAIIVTPAPFRVSGFASCSIHNTDNLRHQRRGLLQSRSDLCLQNPTPAFEEGRTSASSRLPSRDRCRSPISRRNYVDTDLCYLHSSPPCAARRNRDRTPVLRRHAQTPMVLDIPINLRGQQFLAPIDGEGQSFDLFNFRAMPITLPSGCERGWHCRKSMVKNLPGGIVVGRYKCENFICTVSIPAVKAKQRMRR